MKGYDQKELSAKYSALCRRLAKLCKIERPTNKQEKEARDIKFKIEGDFDRLKDNTKRLIAKIHCLKIYDNIPTFEREDELTAQHDDDEEEHYYEQEALLHSVI